MTDHSSTPLEDNTGIVVYCDGSARPNPSRGGQSVSNISAYEDRVTEWTARFIKDASHAVAESAAELDMDRLLIAAEGDLCNQFIDALPKNIQDLVVAKVSTNLIDMTAFSIDCTRIC